MKLKSTRYAFSWVTYDAWPKSVNHFRIYTLQKQHVFLEDSPNLQISVIAIKKIQDLVMRMVRDETGSLKHLRKGNTLFLNHCLFLM